MSQPDSPAEWQAWVDRACGAVGVDPGLVDTTAVLALTKTVADRYLRPMAPVAAHILGIAIGARGGGGTGDLIGSIISTLPTPPGESAGAAGPQDGPVPPARRQKRL